MYGASVHSGRPLAVLWPHCGAMVCSVSTDALNLKHIRLDLMEVLTRGPISLDFVRYRTTVVLISILVEASLDDPGKPPPTRPATPRAIVDLLYRTDGSRDKRPVHTTGIAVDGFFQPSQVAPRFCRAAHFQPLAGGHPVTVRFSNGSGCAAPHDDWSDVRGMATRFTLPTAKDDPPAYTDLIAMTLPQFFTSTPDAFQDFAILAQPAPFLADSPWRKIRDMLHLTPPMRNPYPDETISPDRGAMAYADTSDEAKAGVFGAAAIGAPVSYLRAAYHAVHTFFVTGTDGARRPVRFSWQPVLGVRSLPTDAPYDPRPQRDGGDTYLQDELRATLRDAQGNDHPRFTLMMMLGEAGDALDDPSRLWPQRRQRIMMGTLAVTSVVHDPDSMNERLSFNPGLLTEGIEMSDDPVLRFRVETYKWSSAQRDAIPCPFSGNRNDAPKA